MSLWILLAAAQAQDVLSVPADYSLESAIANASPGDIIEVDNTDAWARDTSTDQPVTMSLTIRGINGKPRLPRMLVDGADGSVEVTFESVELRGVNRAYDGVGEDIAAVFSEATVFLDDVDITGTLAGSLGILSLESELVATGIDGSGLYAGPALTVLGGRLDVVDSAFAGNFEGSITVSDADLTVLSSSFEGNWAYTGADILVSNNALFSALIDDCDFTYSTGDIGGAISAGNADLTVLNSRFADTFAWTGGGGILIYGAYGHQPSLWVENTSFDRTYGGDGGAIAVGDVLEAVIETSTFTETSAAVGGALLLGGGSVTVRDSTFDRSSALWSGGAIHAGSGDEVATNAGATDLLLERVSFTGTPDTNDSASGGCLAGLAFSTVTVRDSIFDHCGASLNGGAIAFSGELLDIQGSSFRYDRATWGGVLDMANGTLRFVGNTATDNVANQGGAISTWGTKNEFSWNWMFSNLATEGNVIEMLDATSLELWGNRFCDNQAPGAGHVVHISGGEGDFYPIRNNVWLHNRSDLGAALQYNPADWLGNNGPPALIHNNDFIANTTSVAALVKGEVDFRNNIVMGHPIGLLLDNAPWNNALTGGYNLWKENAAPAQGTSALFPSETAVVEQSPQFQEWIPGDCNSNLFLAADSPARDAGDPALTDPDGGRSDIGAYGGPMAGLNDLDGDGVFEDLDCDDSDPAVHPGVPDIPYDGIDNDCDGFDLCDGDGDGFDAAQCGGPDCDDTDDSIHPGARDLPNDDIDQNCDEFQPQTWVSGGSSGCGCDGTGGLGGVAWLLPLLLIRRSARPRL